MTARSLAALAAVFLAAPAIAGAGAELDGAAFDGSRARPAVELVRPGASQDKRTPAEIATEEQAKADARVPAQRNAPSSPLLLNAAAPAAEAPADDAGALYGLAGLGVGALFGGFLALGLSRLNA